jgi:DUF1680 family protein
MATLMLTLPAPNRRCAGKICDWHELYCTGHLSEDWLMVHIFAASQARIASGNEPIFIQQENNYP